MNRLDYIDIPIGVMTLLELYWYDKVWTQGMPMFEELDTKRIDYLLNSDCFAIFMYSERAKRLQLEMLAKLN